MVKSVSSFSRNGLRDFLLQRLSAVYIAFFLVALLAYIFSHDVSDYYAWHKLFQNTVMRVSSVLFLLSLMIHTQIGLWSVMTDYVKDVFTRLLFLSLTFLVLLSSLIWGVIILWS